MNTHTFGMNYNVFLFLTRPTYSTIANLYFTHRTERWAVKVPNHERVKLEQGVKMFYSNDDFDKFDLVQARLKGQESQSTIFVLDTSCTC